MPEGPSQYGYLPGRDAAKTIATGVPGILSGNVMYAAPAVIMQPVTYLDAFDKDGTTGQPAITPLDIMGGLYLRDCSGSAQADTLPDAADLVAAFNGAVVGSGFRFLVKNIGGETLSLVAGADTTAFAGDTLDTPTTETAEYMYVFNSVAPGSEACTLYLISSSVHT